MRMLVFAAMAVFGTGLLLGQETTQASTGTSLPRRIAAGIAEGNIVTKVPPVYPPIAQAAHVEGTVRLHAIIAKDGRVKNLEVMDGPPMLTAAAIDSVKQWVYKPYLLNGEPTEVDTTISVNFALGDAGPGGQTGGDMGEGPLPPPPPPPPQPVTIRGGLVAGKLLQRVAPVYPADAKAAGIEGTVVLKGLIGKDGTLKDLHVISGPEQLRQAAIDATSQWVYSPYLLNGNPVEVDTTVSVNFNLNSAMAGATPGAGRKPLRISGGVMAGLLLSKVQPVYPLEAKYAGIQGAVVLHALVGKDGRVIELNVISGQPQLATAALDAVKQWTYKPFLLNGEPVDVDTTVIVNFNLAGR